MKLFFYLVICLMVLLLLVVLLSWLSFSLDKSFTDKSSSFECGFYSFSGSSFPFSMPFFIISLMFLLFDVEILLVCFYPVSYLVTFYSSFFVWLILFVILLATLFEWFKGVLSWV